LSVEEAEVVRILHETVSVEKPARVLREERIAKPVDASNH